MLKRIIPFAVFTLLTTVMCAQVPQTVSLNGKLVKASKVEMPCNNAGNVSVSLGMGVNSNDPLFLCFGDSLLVDHQGGQDLSGDPIPGTPPGVGYAFYSKFPTVDGPTLANILFDPSVLSNPPAPGGLWVATAPTPVGDMYFKNTGYLQQLFGLGGPVQIYFAPITLDNWATKGFENGGPCVNVSLAETFSVVYLNQIKSKSMTTQASGGTTSIGGFVLNGGWPEWNGSQNYTIDISLKSNPVIKGNVTSGIAKHNSTVSYTVPQDGVYVITVSDGKTCPFSFEMVFPAVSLTFGNITGEEGDTVCIEVTADNWQNVVAQELFMQFDPSVLQFISGTFFNPSLTSFIDFIVPPGNPSILINTIILKDTDIGSSIPDNSKLMTLCFKLIGSPFECSNIVVLPTYGPSQESNLSIAIDTFDYLQYMVNSNVGEICIIPQGSGLQAATTSIQPLCNGGCDGSFQLKVAGGSAPYNYNWTKLGTPTINGSGTLATSGEFAIVNNLCVGIYTVTITDASSPNETEVINVVVQEPGVITPDFLIIQPSCFDSNNGSITITATNGGTPPYIESWNTALPLDQLPNGSYTVSITDVNNCPAVFTQVLNTTQVIVNLVSKQDIGCGGAAKGSITVAAAGGTPTYDYDWGISGQTSTTITGLDPGTYTVTVSDSEGCTDTLSATIVVVSGVLITGFDTVSILCNNQATGLITVKTNIPAGVSISNYNWKGPSATANLATINNLVSGTYFITITDTNGCTATDSVFISQPTPIVVTDSLKITPSCPGSKNGSLGVTVTGGTPSYIYTWSSNNIPGGLSVISGLGAGVYKVSITDSNNCPATVQTLTLEDVPKIIVSFSNIISPLCFNGPCTGSVIANAVYSDGSNGSFNFKWESGETDNNTDISGATSLCAGWQSITITDSQCGIVDSVFVPAAEEIIVTIAEVVNVSCSGGSDGSAELSVSGGSPNYFFQWSSGAANTAKIINLPASSYVATVSDSKGCTAESPLVQVQQPDPMVAFIDQAITSPITCAGIDDGVIAVRFEGGNSGPATYLWSPNVSQTEEANDLGPGTYLITITDSKGCTASVNYTLFTPPPVGATIPPITEPECFGFQTFVSIINPFGGTGAPYKYTVDNGPLLDSDVKAAIFAGNHIVTVYDGKGCFTEYSISVGEPDEVVVNLGPDLEVELGDSLQILPFISTSDISSFTWTPTTYLSNTNTIQPIVKPNEPTIYTLVVFDGSGCSGQDEIFVDVDNNRNVYIPNTFSPNADGINDLFRIGTGIGVRNLKFIQIFDRWGEKVFEINNVPPSDVTGPGWDGRFRGRYVDPGVFVYMVSVEFLDNVTLLYRGDITVMR